MNEFEAAMGLCELDDIEEIIQKRKIIYDRYSQELKGFVTFQKQNENATPNYSYFPVVLESEEQLKTVQKALNKKDIFPRRYFYPSLDTLSYLEPKQYMPISRDISRRILCLPIYPRLTRDEQDIILDIIKGSL